MEKAIQFIKENFWFMAAGLAVYAVFLLFTFSGNRMCDCESTEKYNPNPGHRSSVNRFYHK